MSNNLTINKIEFDESESALINEQVCKALNRNMTIEDTQHFFNEYEFIIDWDITDNVTEYFIVESIPERVRNKTAGRDYHKFKIGEVDKNNSNESDLFFKILEDNVRNINAIEKYNKIVNDYYVRAHNEVYPIFKKQRTEYDFILTKLENFYFITNYISSLKIKASKNYQKALFTIMSKASLDLLGIYNCLYKGLESQAEIIHRSLYEAYVYCEFIFKEDTENRIELFYNYQFVKRWYHIQEQLKLNPNYLKELNVPQEKIDAYEKDYNRFKNDYHLKQPHHWAYKIFKDVLPKHKNPTFKYICSQLGLEYQVEYNSVYGTTSLLSHPSSIVGDYYTVTDEINGGVIVNSPMYKDSLVNVAIVSLDYCSHIILHIINYFDITEKDELTRYIHKYHKMAVDECSEFLKNKKRFNH